MAMRPITVVDARELEVFLLWLQMLWWGDPVDFDTYYHGRQRLLRLSQG
jgi:hypothetical protein